jgi:diaminohydroxyphosphoribosylaminopyrimidine deaminase/5-amino-6-(5-phosphoribosylamino)uracil reductase
MKKDDKFYMNLCLKLALKARGKTSPNPLVGALVVKNNRIISSGFHKKAGFLHAETEAIEKAKGKARGATLYVTLEPCTHYGKTPPCVDQIIKSGIKNVVVGMVDPNPVNNGKGVAILRKHNIKVKVGVLEKELAGINRPFIKYITSGLPLVTVKVAQSLDGRIATSRFQSKWITSEQARGFSHALRKYYDAIILGVNTVVRDNPLLKEMPIKVVVDSSLRIPLEARILSDESKGKVIIACIRSRLKKAEGMGPKINKIKEMNCQILELKEKNGRVDLKQLMRKLADFGIINCLVEGGGELIGSLFDAKLVDKIMFFTAPKIIGGKNAVSSVEGQGRDLIYQAIKLKGLTVKKVGPDFLFEADVDYK